ncbi:hemerythrin domain-containing protein [Massilia sp. GCM10023247]|uniref:hemerythrin domain-containing protein n=1 Tax=Massilia sp. GCM10023247 TaxID=3252643 RepID=UPI00361F3452
MASTGTHPHASADALTLLRRDHLRVRLLFIELDSLRGIEDEDERKAELVDDICYELTVHSMLEEEIFYPALRAALGDDDLLDEAELDHAGARELIGQLEVMYPGDEHFEATVAVLAEEVEHHTAIEESELFDAARAAQLDLEALGLRMAARRAGLDDFDASAGAPDTMEPHEGRRSAPRAPD